MVARLSIALLTLAAVLAVGQANALAAPERTPPPPPSHGRVYGNGSGLIGMDVEFSTGKVTRVWMIASTGYRDLDKAAIDGFRNWRFKPRTARHVRTPITFRIKGKRL